MNAKQLTDFSDIGAGTRFTEAVVTQAQSAVSPEFGNMRKKEFLDYSEAHTGEPDGRNSFNAAYREDDRKFMRFLVPSGKRILELGCGRGELLATLQPSYGVGVDFAPRTIERAKQTHPDLHFVLGDAEDPATLSGIKGPFDYIVLADTIGMFEDIDGTLRRVHQLCTPSTRIIISYYSHLWKPIVTLASLVGLRARQPTINFIASVDFLNLMDL